MTEKLTNPNKPAHEITKVLSGDDAIRNDGVQLTAANKNAWYVLATIYGEQGEGTNCWNFDKELAAKNRRAWNGWICSDLDDAARADRAEKTGQQVADLMPLDQEVLADLTKRLRKRLNDPKAELPDRTENIIFSKVNFSRFVNFDKFVFEKNCYFVSATFGGSASFESATFGNDAYFVSATFGGSASFESATFGNDAYFGSATFGGFASFESATFGNDAYFVSATFGGSAYFVSATFEGFAYFGSATFGGFASFESSTFGGSADFGYLTFGGPADFGYSTFGGYANFSSAILKSTTDFTTARFLTAVPQFHAAQLYDDTVFPAADSEQGNWPPLRKRVKVAGKWQDVMPAAEQKRAYNRLRLFMNKSLQLDEEQFFHRMEMRCKTRLARWYHKPLYWLYGGLSDFGNSVVRPIFGIGAVIAFGAVFMLWWQGVFHLIPQEAGMDWTFGLTGKEDTSAEVRKAFGWGVSNTLPFLGFGRLYYGGEFAADLDWPLRVVGGVQTLLGFGLLFLFGLGLRNRFRLR